MLLGHDDDNGSQDIGHLRVTYHHNWFDATTQRHPRVRFGNPVHVYNNYYGSNGGYGVASTEGAGVLVEGNYFENVDDPYHLGEGNNGTAFQIGEEVVAFSRRLNDVTAAVPEVVEAVRALPARDLILDGEVLSLDPDDRPRPFQITMRRFGRKLDVDRMRAELPLSPFWFDLLYLNGRQSHRRNAGAALRRAYRDCPGWSLVPHLITANADRAEEFLREALSRGHEGIMAKDLQAGYAAGARGQSWLKVKQARSLDLVILAAEWGNGRRQGWLSNLHLGARDTEKGGFAMLGKTFKGLTDEMLAWQTEQLLKIQIARDSYTVHVEPKLVAEIAFNEIQISPRYASGLALRFARVKRYRPDKSANDSDTFETVRKLAGL